MDTMRIDSGPKWLQAAINGNADMIDANEPKAGDGINISDAPGGAGKIITAVATAAAGKPIYPPFAVITQANPDVSGAWQYAVLPGTLQLSGTPDDTISIDNVSPTTDPDDLIWNDWGGSDDVIYLDGTVDLSETPAVTSVNLTSRGEGGSFDTSAVAWEPDAFVSGDEDSDITGSYNQDEFCYPIAFITASSDDGSPVVRQFCATNLVIKNYIESGSAAVYPQPV